MAVDVTLQAAIEAELPFLRAEATARMRSTATVRRLTGREAQNEETGEEVPEWEDVYTGPFRLGGSNSGSSGTRTLDIGGVEVQVAVRVGQFPFDTDTLADNDLIEITAGENAGVVLRIVEAEWQDQATARRVPVVSAERPAEWA